MKTLKPVLGLQDVIVKEIVKKGTEERFTITLTMQLKDSEREFKDVLFFDAENTNRAGVLPAILRALAEQIDLPEEEFITDDGECLDYNEDVVMNKLKGKEISVERTQVISERNGQIYYNVNYKPQEIFDEDPKYVALMTIKNNK